MNYRYSLDNNRPSKLFQCPNCGKKTFKRYIDRPNNTYLDASVGRCNREVKCGYHFSPREHFETNTHYKCGTINYFQSSVRRSEGLPQNTLNCKTDYIEQEIFLKTTDQHEKNGFYQFLVIQFGEAKAKSAAIKFHIGTSKHWKGAVIFWQIDIHNRIRTGKIMLYNSETGKRIKEPFSHINWAHRLVKKSGTYQLRQCFFGEHQIAITPKYYPVGIVESEKTAIIASILMPELIWLACGSISNLSLSKFYPIADRRIILYPDLNAFAKWSAKAKELSIYNIDIHVSRLLEDNAHPDERAGGYDLADYLLLKKYI